MLHNSSYARFISRFKKLTEHADAGTNRGTRTGSERISVNEVCEHDSLMTRVMEQAKTIAEIDPLSVKEIRTMYETLGNRSDDDAYLEEAKWSRRWMKERFDAATFESQRDGIISRGSSQQ